MNKTITINLGGINFHIDENAYNQLKQYLDSVSASLDPESRTETMQDIEARIAELFIDRLQDLGKVVNQLMVQKIIEIMGQPEDYQVDDEKEANTETESQQTDTASSQKTPKKLYRDIDNRAIGGVCTGLGHYMGIDRVWVRLIFLLLLIPIFAPRFILPTGSTILLLYIILWIVTPAARTTSQKLEMQGEKIDIDNIQRKVKEEYQTVKGKLQNGGYHKAESFLDKLGHALLITVKIIAIFIGIIITIIAGISLIAVGVSLFSLGAISFAGITPLAKIISIFPQLPAWLIYSTAFILSSIPLLLLLFLGIKIISPKRKVVSLTTVLILVGIWILAWTPVIIGLASSPKVRNGLTDPYYSSEFNKDITFPTNDSLFIQLSNASPQEKELDFDTVTIALSPSSEENKVALFYAVETDHPSTQADDIRYPVIFDKDTLRLGLHSFLKPTSHTALINHAETKAILHLSEKTVFKIDTALEKSIRNFPKAYSNHYLNYKNGRLHCTDCPEDKKTTSDTINSKDDDEWYQDSTITN